jgi:ubiquinone/menaquinone biosynthesis C-methylase UbiE
MTLPARREKSGAVPDANGCDPRDDRADKDQRDRDMGTSTMSTVQTERASDGYALERTPREYDRLRAQSQAWEPATRRLIDQIALAPGARCLDAGCGPGETMHLMAERVGPSGQVVGVDIDAALGGEAVRALHDAGHHQCEFVPLDVSCDEFPGGPYDLVYARLLLYHLPQRSAVLRGLWDAVAPGGHLLVQDYDLRAISVLPALASVDELARVVVAAFTAAGCDVHVGARLPELFVRAGIGSPDGTDVAGRLEALGDAHTVLTGVYQSIVPTAIARGITTQERAAALLVETVRDAARFPDRAMLWPLLVGAWKRKSVVGERGA